MSEGAKTLRLSKVAKEFNLSLGKIVEFLASKGHPVENNPNAKIGDDEHLLLLKEFSGDKTAREEADNIAQNVNKLKRDPIVLIDTTKKKLIDETPSNEIVFKDLTTQKLEVIPEKIELIKETEIIDGPKVIGTPHNPPKIDVVANINPP